MWNLIFKNDTNELIYKTETDLQIWKQTCGYQRGNMEGEGINQEFGINMHILLYNIDNQQGPIV